MSSRIDRNQPIIVCGGGGFIGGHLVAEMLKHGYKNVVCVDKKPMDGWYQVHRGVTKDGQRFLVNVRAQPSSGAAPLTVVLNWTAAIHN